MKKSIQFIQCLTIINGNAEARRSLRTFPVVAWLGLQTRVISKAIENELADAKETFTVQAIHTSQLRSTCFSFETFTTLISQLNFVFHYFSSKQAFIFIFFFFFFFFSHCIHKQMFLFSYFFSMLARLFKSCGTYRFSFSFSPTYLLLTPSECSWLFTAKEQLSKFSGFQEKRFLKSRFISSWDSTV